jgi:hypothetical protein
VSILPWHWSYAARRHAVLLEYRMLGLPCLQRNGTFCAPHDPRMQIHVTNLQIYSFRKRYLVPVHRYRTAPVSCERDSALVAQGQVECKSCRGSGFRAWWMEPEEDDETPKS